MYGGPTQGRSPSFTNLKSKDRVQSPQTPHVGAGGIQRERSFVEPNFVETFKPPQVQVQPFSGSGDTKASPQASAAAAKISERLEEKVAHLHTQQELATLKEETDDLKEKLETLKIKRAKDLEKLKEFEKMRIQFDQLVEFKARIMESQSQLQKEVQKAKHEAREAVEAKERHAEDMAELSETVEMATLDKEMAEEKAETLQLELEAAKDKIEELTLDLDIIKTEMGDEGGLKDQGGGGAVTHYEVKHLQAQNEKLRETLVKMRDLSAHEKSEMLRLTKDSEERTAENAHLTKENEKLRNENEGHEDMIADLQEQVDAALGAEEMVENLTTKCLDLEDKVAALIEEKQDLETLHEVDEEMQENLREAELELREQLDLTNGKVREMARARDAAYEIIHDHETTINKFRDLVSKVQEQNADLRHQLEKETNKPVSAEHADMIDFKKMFAETKAHSKAIDMELRKCEVAQANRHIHLLNSYMSVSFLSRGGDSEAVLALLLVPRIIWKVSILQGQIKDKFVGQEEVTIDKNALLKGHCVERFAFGNQMMFYLHCLTTALHQYDFALSTCSPETFLRIGTLFPEMSAHEKAVDFYIELLRKDQLDENIPLESIEKCLHYFQSVYPLHLAEEKVDCTNHLANNLKVLNAACECLETEVAVGKALMHNPNDDSEIAMLFKLSEGEVGQLKHTIKTMKRRLPLQEQHGDGTFAARESSIAYPASEGAKTLKCVKEVTKLVKTFYVFGRTAAQQAGLLPDPEFGLPAVKTAELLHAAVGKILVGGDDADGLDCVRNTLARIGRTLSDQNKLLQDGDWDADPAKERELRMTIVAPVELRAETYKSEIKEAESIKYKLENKEHDIKDLRRVLKEKSEELSEMQVRKGKAEKRLQDANRDAEVMREKLQRKLDDTQTLLKRKEKEFEETMDQLQNDIDSLESERGELKTKLKETTKKVFIDSISRSPASTSNPASLGPMSLGPSVPTPIKDSPMLLQQNHDLQMAILSIKEASYRRKSEQMQMRLARMKPITVPQRLTLPSPTEKRDASKEDTPTLEDLNRRLGSLKQRVDSALASANVIDLSDKSKQQKQVADVSGNFADTARKDLITQAIRDKSLKVESEKLRLEVARFLASRRPGGEVEADFCKFPSPQLSRSINEKDYALVGRIKLSAGHESVGLKTVPLIVGPKDLHMIHQKVL